MKTTAVAKREMDPSEVEAWNRIVASCDNGKFYHLYQWGTLLKQVHGHELVYLREDDAVFPLACVKSPIFGKRLISLPFADYGGPCARDQKTAEKLIFQCQEAARELGVDFVEIRSPGSQYFDALEKHGFARRDDYFTFVMRIDKTIEELWKAIGDKTRNRVRKAEKSGVQVIEATNKSDLRAFYILYQKTMKRLGSPPQPYRFFEAIWDSFYPDHMMMPLARYEGQYIAGGLSFLHGNAVHAAYGCSDQEYGNLAANVLIEWHAMRRGQEKGYERFDLGRTRENEGTVQFKKRWGGDLTKMPYFYKFYKKTLNERQEVRYKWASRIWSKYVPGPLANSIGPWIIKQVG